MTDSSPIPGTSAVLQFVHYMKIVTFKKIRPRSFSSGYNLVPFIRKNKEKKYIVYKFKLAFTCQFLKFVFYTVLESNIYLQFKIILLIMCLNTITF